MKIPNAIVMLTSLFFTPIIGLYMTESVKMMTPWVLFVIVAVIADLIAGIRKSWMLKVRISPSKAFRVTMGKIVVYVAFVLMVCMFDVVEESSGEIAKWCCAFIAVLEIGSVISNILKPYGIDLSMKGILKFIFKRTPLRPDDREADEIFREQREEEMRKEEIEKWGHKE